MRRLFKRRFPFSCGGVGWSGGGATKRGPALQHARHRRIEVTPAHRMIVAHVVDAARFAMLLRVQDDAGAIFDVNQIQPFVGGATTGSPFSIDCRRSNRPGP